MAGKGWVSGPNAHWQRAGAQVINRNIRNAVKTKKRISLGRGMARALAQQVHDRGGFTYSVTGKFEQVKGYAISVYPQFEKLEPIAAFDADDLESYVKAHQSTLGKADCYLGLWHNKDDGQVNMDVSVAYGDLKTAVNEAWSHSQLSIYDLGKGIEIPTGKRNGSYKRLTVPGVS